MTITTLWKYLRGNRRAIAEIAGCPESIWVGLLFVFSAALAREYDGADLFHEPWHLVLPLGASLVTSFLLFLLVCVVAGKGGSKEPFLIRYLSFLGLYWMTAPLAWLYAIPVERFLDPATATEANLWLLALVATWRVALMVRVIAVHCQVRAWRPFFIVMFFADTIALVMLLLTPLPVFDLMGGIRLSPSEQTIRNVACLVQFGGVLSWPAWLVGTIVAARSKRSEESLNSKASPAANVHRSLWILAAGSLAFWIVVLPLTQPEQQLKWRVERDLRGGRLEEAILLLSSHERSDFPPHWDPPPRLGYGETSPAVSDVIKVLAVADSKPWVRSLYGEKIADVVYSYEDGPISRGLSDDSLDAYLILLGKLPERAAIVVRHHRTFQEELQNTHRSLAVRERLKGLLQEAGFGVPNELPAFEPPNSEDSQDTAAALDESNP